MTDQPGQPARGGGGADDFAPDPRNVRLLKFAVIAMAVLLVIGTIVIIVTIAYRASTLKGNARPGGGFGDVAVDLPAGAAVRSITLDGDRLAIHAGDEIVIVDVRKGTVAGRVVLKPGR